MRIFEKGQELKGIGISTLFIKHVAKILNSHTDESILTVLHVNEAALELHRLCIEGTYHAALKPIYIKGIQSCKSSLLAPFYTIPSDKTVKLAKNIKITQLHFPLVHLYHLAKRLGYIEILSMDKSNHCLIVRDLLTPVKKTYRLKISGLKQIDTDDFFASSFYAENQEASSKEVYVYDRNMQPVMILGIEREENVIPIIADIDAHAYCTRENGERVFDTLKQDEQKALSKLTAEYLDQPQYFGVSPGLKDLLINNVPATMGIISAREYIIFSLINIECGRLLPVDFILQHGPTTNFPTPDPRLPYLHEEFPYIRDKGDAKDDVFAAIFSDGRAAGLTGLEVLEFYLIINSRGYHIQIHPVWEYQLRDLDQGTTIQMDIDLTEAGLINPQNKEILLKLLAAIPQNSDVLREFLGRQIDYEYNRNLGHGWIK